MKKVTIIPMEERRTDEVLNDSEVYVIRASGYDFERFHRISEATVADILNPDSIVLRISDEVEEETSE